MLPCYSSWVYAKISQHVRKDIECRRLSPHQTIGTDFREGDEGSNFSVFRVRRFTESPGPLH